MNRAVACLATARVGLQEKYMEKKITAPKMVALEYRNLSMGQRCTLNKESTVLLNTLLERLSKFQWNGETERWKFWVSVPRGI